MRVVLSQRKGRYPRISVSFILLIVGLVLLLGPVGDPAGVCTTVPAHAAAGEEAVSSAADEVPEQDEGTWTERLMHVLGNPNMAYLLLTIGMLGLLLELYVPGVIIPGAVGAVALTAALYSLSILGAPWSGVLLVALGFVLFALEPFVARSGLVIKFGLLTAGGLAVFIVGSLVLSAIGIDYRVVSGVVVVVGVFVMFVVRGITKAQQRQAVTGHEGLVGAAGVTLTALDPKGTVLCAGERWRAVVEDGHPIEAKEQVTVVRVEGLTLMVRHRGRGES
jgi:membrane-bound serine protease (ClpP class)